MQSKEKDAKVPSEIPISNAIISAGDSTGAGTGCALAIVPVRVKLSQSSKYICTYAFLDPGSTATFCTNRLMNHLHAKGRRTTILLQTMGQQNPTRTYEVTGLEIGHLQGGTYISLPKVYTQNKIPVSKDNIITKKDLKDWPHLDHIQLDEIDADIELLIGTDIPRAMEPWHVINSKNNGPYAVKTLLGWVVSGPLKQGHAAVEYVGPIAVTSNRISVMELKDLLIKQYNQDFCENKYEEKKGDVCGGQTIHDNCIK